MHRNKLSPRYRVQKEIVGATRVKQSCADECDINRIVAKYRKTGLVDHLSSNSMCYVDMSDSKTYHESLNLVLDVQESFDALPADLRKRFQNDPMQLLDFVADESNREEMYDLGLAEKPKIVESDDADVKSNDE